MMVALEIIAAIGILTTLSVTGGLLTIKIAEHIIEEAEKRENEKDYVYMKDGTPVEFNEEDQE